LALVFFYSVDNIISDNFKFSKFRLTNNNLNNTQNLIKQMGDYSDNKKIGFF